MTQPADPNVFLRKRPVIQQEQPPTPVTNGPLPKPLTPPPATPPVYTTADPTPPSNPDLDPATGQPRNTGKTTGGNTWITNSDGTSVVTDANGQVVLRRNANGQITFTAPGYTPPPATGPTPGLPDSSAPPPGPSTGTGTAGGSVPPINGQISHYTNGSGGQSWTTSDGRVWGDETSANTWQGQLDAQARGTLGVNQGLAQTQDSQSNAYINNQALMNRVTNQTTGDIARVSEGGAEGVNRLDAAAADAAGVGTQIYNDARAQAAEALARGDAALAESIMAGVTAANTATTVAAPMYNLAANDQANGANARSTADAYSRATGVSLADAESAIQRLQQLSASGDVNATQTLERFGGNAGTSAGLKAFNPGVATNVGGFQGNAGNAPALENLNTNVPGTAALGAFTSNNGTAPALAGVDTRAAATGNLMGFTGTSGTAPALANIDTRVSGTGALQNFEGTGGRGLETLERFASGGDIGPSAAEALLQKKSDIDMGQALALARSGRGAGESAGNLRRAIFENAATGQQTGADLAALRAEEAATARGQNVTAATAAAGTSTALSGQKLSAEQSVQEGQMRAVSDKISALVASGGMSQKQADQILQGLTSAQTGQLQSTEQRINALVASGQMDQTQAGQLLDAAKAVQQGQLASVAQKSENLATAGAQRQTQAAQQLDAQKAQQATELQQKKLTLDAMVAAGQMDQKQADQQLAALTAAQQGQLQTIQNNIAASTGAATAANNSAAVNADLTKAFATLGLQYDVNSGNVLNNAGEIVMTGQQVKQQFMSSGLQAQTGQGATAANITATGSQALTNMTNTSVDAQKAAAVLGFQTAAAIASLSQGELAQLQALVNSQNQGEMQNMLAQKGIALQVDQSNAQSFGATMAAIGTIAAGAALLLSDVRAKTDIQPTAVDTWLAANGLNTPGPSQPSKAASSGLSDQQKMQLMGLAGQFGGQLGGAIASDEKGKIKKPETFEEWLDLMPTDFRAAKGYSYKYKDPEAMGAEPGEHYGPMAQSLQHTAAGGAVSKMPNGMLGVDPRKTIMPMIAAVSEQQRRIDALEDLVKGRKSEKKDPKQAALDELLKAHGLH